MNVTVSSSNSNHISRYICPKSPGFQEMEACSLLVNLRKVKNDHRGKFSNLSNWMQEA